MSEKKKSQKVASSHDSIRTLLSAAIALSTMSLDLRERRLPQLCAEFVLLHRLEYLYLEGNLLVEVPAEVVHGWRSLRWLDLRNNLLVGLPSTVGELRNLRTLLLAGNRISQLPSELGNLSKLTGLNLSGNPLTDPPRSVVEQGTRYVLSYLLKKQSESQLSPPIPAFTPRSPMLVYPDKRAYPSEYPEDDSEYLENKMPPELILRRAKLFAIRGMRNPVPKRFPSPANFSLQATSVQPQVVSFAPKKKSILKNRSKQLISIAKKPEKSLVELINEKVPLLPPNPPNTQQRHGAIRLGDPASQARLVLNESQSVLLGSADNHFPAPRNKPLVPVQNRSRDISREDRGEEKVVNIRANRPKEARLRREVERTGKIYEDKGYSLTPFTGGLDII